MRSTAWRCVLLALCFCLGASTRAMGEEGPAGVPCSNPLPELRRGAFQLEVGQAQLSDGPSYLTEGRPCEPVVGSPCEFSIELTRAEEWGSQPRFLLAIVNTDHRLGSGAWDSVFVYVCRDQFYVPVINERYYYGAKVLLGSKSDLWITTGVWGARDPSCCASSVAAHVRPRKSGPPSPRAAAA
jgi:hypothetical protein